MLSEDKHKNANVVDLRTEVAETSEGKITHSSVVIVTCIIFTGTKSVYLADS